MISRIRVLTLWMACMAIGWTGLSDRNTGASVDAAELKPTLEAVAFAGNIGYLDGPNLEAFGQHNGRKGSNDEDGNWFVMRKYTTSSLRCIRLDNKQIETIVGDNRWGSNLDITEGPAAYFPNMSEQPLAGDQSVLGVGLVVYGLPLKGEDYGSIYIYSMQRRPYRVFKNTSKNGRWWFKALGTPGAAKPPTTTGATAKVIETDFANARVGEGWITWTGNLYKFDEAKGLITCVLTPADYVTRAKEAVAAFGKTKMGVGNFTKADRMILSKDGTMYVMHPWREGNVFKISKDRTKFEFIIQHNRNIKAANIDGEGLYTTWHCGPSFIKTSNNTLFLRAIDSATVRRYLNGRVSVLGLDGEWRERGKVWNRRKMGEFGGMGYMPANHGLPYIYIHYPGGSMGNDLRVYRFGPVDFTKPTVGPLVQAQK